MKNNKSLLWGLAGLAVIILVGLYVYSQEQQRRAAEAETADRMTAAQQVEEAKKPADEQKTADKSQENATAQGKDATAEKATGKADEQTAAATEDKAAAPSDEMAAKSTDKPAETAANDAASSTTDMTKSAESGAASQEKPLETAALDTGAGTGENAGVVQPDAQDAKTADLLPPQFDLLRVEPDGSTVVAGRAKPGGKLEVVAGDTVVAETKVGSNGDFAAVLDEPLPPGDHEIVLRVVEEGEVVSRSDEVATVSVPKDDPASLLVMVTRPGEASRILTQPEVAAQTASGETTAEPKTQETASATTTEQSQTSDDRVAAAPAQKTEEPKADMTSEGSSTEMAKAETDAQTSAKVEQTTGGTAETEPASQDEPMKADQVETPPVKENTQTAALADKVEERPAKASRVPTEVVPGARLRIDAVEIESGKVFVAGSAAPPGATVRVYADGEAIGESRVSASGRFLVEADRDISVGQHIFSADLMMPGSDASTMRVAVPFTRPRGETVAGVAAPQKEEPAAAETVRSKTADTTSTGSEKPAGQETASAGTASSDETAERKVTAPATDTSSSGEQKETTVAAADPTADKKDLPVVRSQPAGETSEATAPKTETAAATADTGTAADVKPTDDQAAAKPATGSGAEEPKQKDVQTATAPQSETPSQTSTAVVEQGSTDDTATTRIATADGSTEPPTVMQPALEARDGSVIIRRGDTLWQISRRVYGRGVRYTTIYLANTDQINNPDFIEPGQVFMVPEEPLANAEELHRERLRKR